MIEKYILMSYIKFCHSIEYLRKNKNMYYALKKVNKLRNKQMGKINKVFHLVEYIPHLFLE